jgi:Flp pilus assembly pilin Flp
MKIFKNLKNQSGQGMTEYIIIVALIAIAAIAAFSYFGSTVRNQTAAMTEELAGQSGKNETAAAGRAADAAAKDAATTKTLKTYANTESK